LCLFHQRLHHFATMSTAAARLRKILADRATANATADAAEAEARADAAKELEDLQHLLGESSVAGSAPRPGPVMIPNSWVSQVPAGIAAAAAATQVAPTTATQAAAPITATQAAAVDQIRAKIIELIKLLKEKGLNVDIVVGSNGEKIINIKFGVCNRGKIVQRLAGLLGIDFRELQQHPKHPNMCAVKLNLVKGLLKKMCNRVNETMTDSELADAFWFSTMASFCWGYPTKNPKSTKEPMTNLELPMLMAKICGVVQFPTAEMKSLQRRLVPDSKTESIVNKTMNAFINLPNINTSEYTRNNYTQHTSTGNSGGGGGGGASATVDTRDRSVKQTRATATGPSFMPTGKLAKQLERNRYVVGAPNSPAANRLRTAMTENKLVLYSDGLVQASNGSTLTSDGIEKIICKALNMQTTAPIEATAAKTQVAKQKAAYQVPTRATGIGAIPLGVDESSDDESDEKSDEKSDEESDENSIDTNAAVNVTANAVADPVTDGKVVPITGADVTYADEACHDVVDTNVKTVVDTNVKTVVDTNDNTAVKTDDDEEVETIERDTIPSNLVNIVTLTGEKTAIYTAVATKLNMVIDDDDTFRFVDGHTVDDAAKKAVCLAIVVAAGESLTACFK
jgi:hypothetical protein